MVKIPGGTFQMGDVKWAGESWGNPVPAHPVTIKPFAMGQYEVTFEEYDRFAIAEGKLLPNDQGWGRGRRPVINVSWDAAKAYAAWLSKETGNGYRLPTESEWEYAARGRTKNDEWSGTAIESQIKDYAVYSENSGGKTKPVYGDNPRKPNDYGLHDMSGNVWEWVQDCYEKVTEENCGRRVIRGGSWIRDLKDLRASHRDWDNAGTWSHDVGFRLAQDLEP